MIRLLVLAFLMSAASLAQMLPSADAVLRSGEWNGRTVFYVDDRGFQVYEGDILIGETPSGKQNTKQSSVTTKPGALWPNATVPFVIDSDTPNQDGVRQAMAEWTAATGVKFVPRTNEANYARFAATSSQYTCNSYVGVQGGEQKIMLGTSCLKFASLHEIGHLLGLWHEHTRADRSAWIQLFAQNVSKVCVHNYDVQPDSRDAGAYDFASVMHYYPYAYSTVGRPVLETIPSGIPIGLGTGLSAGDIANIRALYNQPRKIFVSSFPEGMPITVDGVAITSTQSFDWAPGSTHTISAAVAVPKGADTRLFFGRWTDNGEPTHKITVDASTSYYTASYSRQFLITTTSFDLFPSTQGGADGKTGTVELTPASADGYYTERSVVLATGRPSGGNFYWRWRGIDMENEGTYAEDGPFAVGYTNPRYFGVNMPKNIQMITTTFPVVIIDTDPPNLWIQVDGRELRAPVNLRNVFADGWQAGSTHALGVLRPAQTCRVLCEDATRWVFQRWSHGGSQQQTVTAPTVGGRFTAVFQRQFLVSSRGSNGGTVSVTPASADGYYAEGAVLTARPTAAAGTRFYDWYGQIVDLDLPSGTAPPGPCSIPARTKLAEPLNLAANFRFTASDTLPPQPVVSNGGVLHGASFGGGAVAPGEFVTLFGSNFGPAGLVLGGTSFAGFADSCLAQTTFLFDGVAAPIYYLSPTKATVIVPYGVAGKSQTTLIVDSGGRQSAPVTLPVTQASPGIFAFDSTGRGQGLFFHADFSLITPSLPAQKGEIILFYATGEGLVTPALLDGEIPDVDRLAKPQLPVEVTFGGVKGEVLYGGTAPGFVTGVLQMNVRIPNEVSSGTQTVVMRVGSASSPSTITIPIL